MSNGPSSSLADVLAELDSAPVLFTGGIRQRLELMAPIVGGVIDQFVDVVVDGMTEGNDGQLTENEIESYAWLEAERLVLSFAAADQQLTATEFWLIVMAFPEFEGGAGSGSDYDELLRIALSWDGWKYRASVGLRLLARVDRYRGTEFVARYAKAAVPLAKLMCALDEEIDVLEISDLRRFQVVVLCAQATADGRLTDEALESLYATEELGDQIAVEFNDQDLLDAIAGVGESEVLRLVEMQEDDE